MAQKWEYRIVTSDSSEEAERLINSVADVGFEVVSFHPFGSVGVDVERHQFVVLLRRIRPAVAVRTGDAADEPDMPSGFTDVLTMPLDEKLSDLERQWVSWALTLAHGNKSKAAELLQIKRSTLSDRIKKFGLDPFYPDE